MSHSGAMMSEEDSLLTGDFLLTTATPATRWRMYAGSAILGGLFLVIMSVAAVAGPHGSPSPVGDQANLQLYEDARDKKDFAVNPEETMLTAALRKELPAENLEKEVFNGIPIYHSDFDSTLWIIPLPNEPKATTAAELAELLTNWTYNMTVYYAAASEHGSAGILIVDGPLDSVKEFLDERLPNAELVEGARKRYAMAEEPGMHEPSGNVSSWGLDRVVERTLSLDQPLVPAGDGSGTHVYVTDTGIRTTHGDFGGRAFPALDATVAVVRECSTKDTSCASDKFGHGTHGAGVIGGRIYGVAKRAHIYSVKSLDDEGVGTSAWWHASVDWVATNALKPAVLSASLQGSDRFKSYTDERVVDNALKQGVIVVVAAGNDDRDACYVSPAFVRSAITVGSTTSYDARSSSSNFGRCIDIFAPGSNITSAGLPDTNLTGLPGSEDGVPEVSLSGTSSAGAHVAGGVAILLGLGIPPAQIDTELKKRATQGAISDIKGSPNNLLYVGEVSDTPPDCSIQGWSVIRGACIVDSQCCLRSPNYPSDYGAHQRCYIKVGLNPGSINVEHFETQERWDKLYVNRRPYSGTNGPAGVTPRGTIYWQSSWKNQMKGWKLCLPNMS